MSLCGILLGAALALAPGRVSAADATAAPSGTDAPSGSEGGLSGFFDETVASIAKPVRTFGLHAQSYHSKVYATSFTHGYDSTSGHMKFNNQTRGLYVINEEGWGTGYYRNSVHRNTFYAGRFVQVWGPSTWRSAWRRATTRASCR